MEETLLKLIAKALSLKELDSEIGKLSDRRPRKRD